MLLKTLKTFGSILQIGLIQNVLKFTFKVEDEK